MKLLIFILVSFMVITCSDGTESPYFLVNELTFDITVTIVRPICYTNDPFITNLVPGSRLYYRPESEAIIIKTNNVIIYSNKPSSIMEQSIVVEYPSDCSSNEDFHYIFYVNNSILTN